MNKILCLTENIMLVLCVVSMTGLVFFQILARIFWGWSSPAMEESARFLMLWAIFLGAVLASREDTHIRMGWQPSGHISAWLGIISRIITFGFLCFFVFFSYKFAKKSISSGMTSIVLNIPLISVHSCFFVSGILMGVHTLLHLHDDILILQRSRHKGRANE